MTGGEDMTFHLFRQYLLLEFVYLIILPKDKDEQIKLRGTVEVVQKSITRNPKQDFKWAVKIAGLIQNKASNWRALYIPLIFM